MVTPRLLRHPSLQLLTRRATYSRELGARRKLRVRTACVSETGCLQRLRLLLANRIPCLLVATRLSGLGVTAAGRHACAVCT